MLSVFCYCLVIAGYLAARCTGLRHLTLITSQFQKQFQETVFERSLAIFTFEITPILTMIVITRSDPYLTFWIRISKGASVNNFSVNESMIPYHDRHGTKQFIREKPIQSGFKLLCFMLVRWVPSSWETMLWKKHRFPRNRIRARFWCCTWYDWEMWSN